MAGFVQRLTAEAWGITLSAADNYRSYSSLNP